MLTITVLLLILPTTVVAAALPGVATEFHRWRARFDGQGQFLRNAENIREIHRNFVRNFQLLHARRADPGFEMALNEFAILDIPSHLSTLNLSQPLPSNPSTLGDHPLLLRSNLPSSVNHQTEFALSRPREPNLRKCSQSSWAFAVTSALEAFYWKRTGEVRLFSEQELVSCACVSGCSRDCLDEALSYLSTRDALSDARSYEYTGKDGECSPTTNVLAANTDVRPALKGSGAGTLQKWLAEEGPVIAPLYTSREFFFYSYGLYNSAGIICNNNNPANYWITVVGYASDHWLIRGNLGPNWGEGGYMRLSRRWAGECELYTDLRLLQLADKQNPSSKSEWDTVPGPDRQPCWDLVEDWRSPPGRGECERNDCNWEGGLCYAKVKITLYKDINYQGVSATFYGSIPDLGLFGMLWNVRSIKIHQGKFMAYSESWYGQDKATSSWTLFHDEPNLMSRGMSERIASIRAIPQGMDLITVYEHTWGRGKAATIYQSYRKLPRKWNDKISSAYSLRQWDACDDDSWKKCERIAAGDFKSNLGSVGLNDEITSVRVWHMAH